MLRLVKFTGDQNYMYPSGQLATPERIRQDFPAVDYFPHVLEINGDVCQAVLNLNALRQIYGIDDALSEDEAIAALEVIINTPPAEPEPTAEERIAAALEYQNLLSL